MQPLDPAVSAAMRAQAQLVRERMNSGANFTRTWTLGGKQGIVEPGRDVIIRLCPRWDIADSMIVQGDKRVPNPAYKTNQLQFVIAFEHWWETGDGKTTREWCPCTVDPKAVCPVCTSSTALMAGGSPDDRAFGKRIQARKVFVWNAVIGNPRRVDASGLADIRPISLPGTLFNAVSDIMTGGDKEQFARGDITHPSEGYDLSAKRPVGGGGERWSAQVAADPSRLYEAAQAAAFKGWVNRLTNLEDMLKKETKSPAGIFSAYYGRDPEPGELKGAPSAAEEPSQNEFQAAPTVQEPSAEPPQAPDDEFMPAASPSRKAPAQGPAPSRQATPAPASRPTARAPRR